MEVQSRLGMWREGRDWVERDRGVGQGAPVHPEGGLNVIRRDVELRPGIFWRGGDRISLEKETMILIRRGCGSDRENPEKLERRGYWSKRRKCYRHDRGERDDGKWQSTRREDRGRQLHASRRWSGGCGASREDDCGRDEGMASGNQS